MAAAEKQLELMGVPFNARKRQVAVSDPTAGVGHGQNAGDCPTSHQTGKGVS